MFKRFILYIDQEPWDEIMKRQQRWLDRATIILIVIAVLYFTPALIHIFTK